MDQNIAHPEVQKFIRDHENDDPVSLILKGTAIRNVSARELAAQITARRKAKNKLPAWYRQDGLIYPPPLSMEQCSSESTAWYKASLVSGRTLYDLTGGAGVDSFYFGRRFKEVVYVEQNASLAEVTAHNFTKLGAENILVRNEKAEAFLERADRAAVIYVDPARRDQNAQRVFRFEDCEPNVVVLLPQLLAKADTVLIKASPMLDLDLSLRELGHVHEVHVVSVDNECKEVLYLLKQQPIADPQVITVNLKKVGETETFSFRKSEEAAAEETFSAIKTYLYEPNASILKAGAFKILSEKSGVDKVHVNTHLYTSDKEVTTFPGRRFKVEYVVPYQKKAILPLIPGKKANIAVRNFPDDVKAIKKKLGLKDGGDVYVFAFTDVDNQRRIAIGRKIHTVG